MFSIFKEKPEKRFTGDIEMKTISSAKKLGNKTLKYKTNYRSISKSNSKTNSKSNSKTNTHTNSLSQKANLSSVSAKRLRNFRARNIYTKRVKYSRCRGLTKSVCRYKKICKFTKGKSRKYCRKKHNKHI